jgi:predicted HNH restriction endonuclease
MENASKKSIWDEDYDVYFTSFWGWSPDTWAVIGWTGRQGETRRDNLLGSRLTNPFIVACYVTKNAHRNNPETSPELGGKIVGFYLVSHEKCLRDEFTSSIHHDRDREKWQYSLRATRAFSYLPKFRPTAEEFYPDLWKHARYISSKCDRISNANQIKDLQDPYWFEDKIYTPRSILEEIEWRKNEFKEIGIPDSCSEEQLHQLGLHSGSKECIWGDLGRTSVITNDRAGLAVSIIHDGELNSDDVSKDGVVYHFPKTVRSGDIKSVANCKKYSVPIFYISNNGDNKKIQIGYVAEIDQDNSQCLILFGSREKKFPDLEEESFHLNETRKEGKRTTTQRQRDPKFRYKLFKRYGKKCALCNVDCEDLLEAAHIKPVHSKGSDHPGNGLVLCRNHHKALDAYLLSIDPETLTIDARNEKVARTVTKKSIKNLETPPETQALEWHWINYKK